MGQLPKNVESGKLSWMESCELRLEDEKQLSERDSERSNSDKGNNLR